MTADTSREVSVVSFSRHTSHAHGGGLNSMAKQGHHASQKKLKDYLSHIPRKMRHAKALSQNKASFISDQCVVM